MSHVVCSGICSTTDHFVSFGAVAERGRWRRRGPGRSSVIAATKRRCRGCYGMPLIPGCLPPGTFGAAGATTLGVNRLPPVVLSPFSVAGVLDIAGARVVVVVGVVEVIGLEGSLLVQALTVTMIVAATMAPTMSRYRELE